MLQKPLYTDEQKARDYAQLAGLDLAEMEAATEKLLCACWPIARALADVLVERKVVSGRRARQILFGTYRKQLRRWRIVAEQDRRNKQAWAAALRQALGQVALKLPPRTGKRGTRALCARRGHFWRRFPFWGGVSLLQPMRSIVFFSLASTAAR